MFKRIAADMDTGTEASKALTKEYANLTKQGQKLGDELIKSGKPLPEISQGFLTAAQSANKMTLASKAATLGMKALSVAGNMLLMWAVSATISAVVEKLGEAKKALSLFH